ncbi:MAG: DUF6702 family protein [Gemmatimonadales bacterium]
MTPHGLLLTVALWLPPNGARHPMHTAVTEIAYDATTREASIRIRLFRDDFTAAIPMAPGTAAGDSAVARYVGSSFTLIDRTGKRLPFRWQGIEQAGDVLVLRFAAAAPAGLAGGQVASTLLSERFDDQVNIVRATYGGRTRTLLFTRGEAAKGLD